MELGLFGLYKYRNSNREGDRSGSVPVVTGTHEQMNAFLPCPPSAPTKDMVFQTSFFLFGIPGMAPAIPEQCLVVLVVVEVVVVFS